MKKEQKKIVGLIVSVILIGFLIQAKAEYKMKQVKKEIINT